MIRTDLTTIRIFLAVYRLRSLTKAGELEHIAPSAVSKRIQDLEADYGVQLFYRHLRGVTPTPAGDCLAVHAARVMEDLNEMAADLSEFAEGDKGEVRIHAHASAVSQYLPAEIASFSDRYPGIRVVLREETSPSVLQSTLDGFADIGIYASNLPAPTSLEVLPYRQDQLVAFIPSNHALADRKTLDFAEIRDSAHISLETGTSLQVLVAGAAQSMGFVLKNRVEVTTFAAAMKMVDAGMGVAIIPAGIVETFGATLRAIGIPLTNDWACRDLAICVRKTPKLAAAARLLVSHLRAGVPHNAYPKTMSPIPNR